jgi:hypothetical protein
MMGPFTTPKERLVIRKGPEYPFMIWVPADKSFHPDVYHSYIRQTPGRNRNLLRIPVNNQWHVWGFQDKESLDAFCSDLSRSLRGNSDDS